MNHRHQVLAFLAALLVLAAPAVAQTPAEVRGSALDSLARTATTSSIMFINQEASGYVFWLDVTAITATPSLTFKIQFQDPANAVPGGWTDYFTAAAAVTSVSRAVYVLHNEGAASGGITELFAHNVPLARWRITVTHADADSATYSVGYAAIR